MGWDGGSDVNGLLVIDWVTERNQAREKSNTEPFKRSSEFHGRQLQHPEMGQILGELGPPSDFSPIILIGLFLS